MALWRQRGQLICECAEPRREYVAIFNGYECRTCGRLVCGRVGAELLARQAELTTVDVNHVHVGTFPDGSQVLIERWDGIVTAAMRPARHDVWSAPVTLRDEP